MVLTVVLAGGASTLSNHDTLWVCLKRYPKDKH